MDEPTPLEFLRSIYMDEDIPLPTRIRAATEAAQYTHPRLAMVAVAHGRDDFASLLDRAVARSNAARSGCHEMKVIEAKPEPTILPDPTPEEVSSERMTKSFQPLRRRL
jgi:hypothetical protein